MRAGKADKWERSDSMDPRGRAQPAGALAGPDRGRTQTGPCRGSVQGHAGAIGLCTRSEETETLIDNVGRCTYMKC